MIGSISNHYSINWLLNNPEVIRSSNFYIAIVIFVLLGAFTKSAQYPFHFWLPKAMQAPTPVSAYLHSATMVKLGVYLVARFTPLLGHTLPWESLLIVFGGITMLSATVLMLRATDLKQLLAYSTIMALGTLMFMLASGSQPEVEAAMVFLFAHALYKACLFLNAGAIDKATGTRELPNLRGLRKAMPITFISTILAALSLAGWPPVIGFISKEMIYVAKLDSSLAAFIMLAVAFITNVGFVCLAYILVVKPFFGKAVSYPGRSTVKEVSFNLFICPLTLAALGLIFGLHPWLVDSSIISPAVSSILNKPISTEITLWHGLTPAFRLSVATSLVALLVYLAYKPINNFLKTSALLTIFSPEKIYEQFLIFLNRFASQTTQIIQPGSLRMYTSALFIVLGALTCFTFFHFKHIAPSTVLPNAPWFTWIIAIVMLAAAYTAITVSSYLVCLVLLGIIGIGSTLIFLLYSAPDVAMTQLLIDVLTIVMIVLALYRLPSLPPYEGTQKRSAYFNLFIALFVGLTITAILLSVVSVPFNYAITNFYDNNSLIAAHGRNIVNVILVDFRAFDTLGEILVVAIAGLGVYGLLNFAKKKKEAK
jgi:multicomponent Na+:H+ antiporter subunit A